MMWSFYEISLAKGRDTAKDPDVYQQLSETAHFQHQVARKSQSEELWESSPQTNVNTDPKALVGIDRG